jgi:hypothetical protein
MNSSSTWRILSDLQEYFTGVVSDEGTLRSLQLRNCRSYDQLENTISFITTPVAREFDVLINENQKKDYISRIVG